MSLDPKVSMWLNVVMSVLGFIAASGSQLTPLFGDHTSSTLVAVAGLMLGLLGAVNAGLHAVSSNSKGPLAS